MSSILIKKFDFNDIGRTKVEQEPLGQDWPVVYLINNDTELYIGETSSASKRFQDHLKNPERQSLTTIRIILDEEFNKSAILDIEQSLIQLCHADQKFTLQNLNGGQSAKHNYYQRELYVRKVERIWWDLKKSGLTNNGYLELKNTDLFKYSPYMSLTSEQSAVCYNVINDIIDRLDSPNGGTSVIEGCAGTGKTIVAINMIYMLVNASRYKQDVSQSTDDFSEEELVYHKLHDYLKKHGDLKIGFVVPMSSIRGTLSKVFEATKNGLTRGMVIKPNDVVKDDYDILFVDESHRLAKRKNIVGYGVFDKTCKIIGLNEEVATQLDWIIHCSKYRVLFYDRDQSVKRSDVTPEQYQCAVGEDARRYYLNTQMRCEGGNSYIDYLKRIFDCRQETFENIESYDFKMFDDVEDMVCKIKDLDMEYGLCRNVGGYSWKWETKGKSFEDIKKDNLKDIRIGKYEYVWNTKLAGWVLSETAIDEIGSIHTVQGFDLNYVGVIVGREIDYDESTNSIVIDRDMFFDKNVKNDTDDETLKRYIINTYKVLMTRGIKGCYVYVCNPKLRNYLKRYIELESTVEPDLDRM